MGFGEGVQENRVGTSRTQKLLYRHDVRAVLAKVELDLLHAPMVAGVDAELRVPIKCAGRLDTKTPDAAVRNRLVGDALACETRDIDDDGSKICEDKPGKVNHAGSHERKVAPREELMQTTTTKYQGRECAVGWWCNEGIVFRGGRTTEQQQAKNMLWGVGFYSTKLWGNWLKSGFCEIRYVSLPLLNAMPTFSPGRRIVHCSRFACTA